MLSCNAQNLCQCLFVFGLWTPQRPSRAGEPDSLHLAILIYMRCYDVIMLPSNHLATGLNIYIFNALWHLVKPLYNFLFHSNIFSFICTEVELYIASKRLTYKLHQPLFFSFLLSVWAYTSFYKHNKYTYFLVVEILYVWVMIVGFTHFCEQLCHTFSTVHGV